MAKLHVLPFREKDREANECQLDVLRTVPGVSQHGSFLSRRKMQLWCLATMTA